MEDRNVTVQCNLDSAKMSISESPQRRSPLQMVTSELYQESQMPIDIEVMSMGIRFKWRRGDSLLPFRCSYAIAANDYEATTYVIDHKGNNTRMAHDFKVARYKNATNVWKHHWSLLALRSFQNENLLLGRSRGRWFEYSAIGVGGTVYRQRVMLPT